MMSSRGRALALELCRHKARRGRPPSQTAAGPGGAEQPQSSASMRHGIQVVLQLSNPLIEKPRVALSLIYRPQASAPHRLALQRAFLFAIGEPGVLRCLQELPAI